MSIRSTLVVSNDNFYQVHLLVKETNARYLSNPHLIGTNWHLFIEHGDYEAFTTAYERIKTLKIRELDSQPISPIQKLVRHLTSLFK